MSFIERANYESIKIAALRLAAGELVAFPTETVYGLGADASNAASVRKVYETKNRPDWHPLIVHIASADHMKLWASDIPDAAQKLANEFWPGPLTIILPRHPNVFDAVTGGLDTVALRVPHHPVAQELLAEFGGGIAAPSANKFGHVSPTKAQHVQNDFQNDDVMILDGGASEIGVESTIVAVNETEIVLVRPGAIGPLQLSGVTGFSVTENNNSISAPGNLPSHYAPKANVRVTDEKNFSEVMSSLPPTAVVFGEKELMHIDNARQLEPTGLGDQAFAREMYDRLREADLRMATDIVAVLPNTTNRPLHAAIVDRLNKASFR